MQSYSIPSADGGASVDLAWMSEKLGEEVKEAVVVTDKDLSGGMISNMQSIKVTTAAGNVVSLVLKCLPKTHLTTSQNLGLAREAIFFNSDISKKIATYMRLPKVIYAYGDMAKGDKELLMADYSDMTQCGYFFGPRSPHNWDKDLSQYTDREGAPTDVAVTEIIAREAARCHAAYWKDLGLTQYEWIKSSEWVKGEKKETWEFTKGMMESMWTAGKEKFAAGSADSVISQYMVDVCDSSLKNCTWDAFQKDLQERGWTFIHGDFHPANMLWDWNATERNQAVVVLDWENVALGSGPQELGQFVISHMDPSVRKSCEGDVLRTYHQALVAENEALKEYTFEECFREYIDGGVGRWVLLFVFLTSICDDKKMKYFHDQVEAFCRDHNVDPKNAPAMRL